MKKSLKRYIYMNVYIYKNTNLTIFQFFQNGLKKKKYENPAIFLCQILKVFEEE